MKIVSNFDLIMVKKKVKSKDLANAIGISEQNISLLKTGKIKGVRFSTLAAICNYLDCQPGDLFKFVKDESQVS